MKKSIHFLFALVALAFILPSCDIETPKNVDVARSGVSEVTAKVKTDIDGKTKEQSNILKRYDRDNQPGSIKHLYIISAYSGQVLMYSTVDGKVTSSGKRLSPTTLSYYGGQDYGHPYHPDQIQDDGTYGSSVEYIYWFDSKGVYRQLYITGGMIVTISDQPIAVKNVVINIEEKIVK